MIFPWWDIVWRRSTRHFKAQDMYFSSKRFPISFSQQLLTKCSTLSKATKSRKLALNWNYQDPKYSFRLQKGIKNLKYFFGFWKWMISAFKRTFNHPHTMITHKEPSHWKYVSTAAGISPPKKKLPHVD